RNFAADGSLIRDPCRCGTGLGRCWDRAQWEQQGANGAEKRQCAYRASPSGLLGEFNARSRLLDGKALCDCRRFRGPEGPVQPAVFSGTTRNTGYCAATRANSERRSEERRVGKECSLGKETNA